MNLNPLVSISSSLLLSLMVASSHAIDVIEETTQPIPPKPLTQEEQIQQNTQRIAVNADDIMTNVYLHHDKQVQIDALHTRMLELENESTIGRLNIVVDCATDSINDAVDNAPSAGNLVINVRGNCTETVVISRSNTTLVGERDASITFAAPVTANPFFPVLNNTISIIGAQNVIIDNLSISGAPSNGSNNTNNSNNNGAGISALHGAAVLIKDSTLHNNYYGMRVNRAVAKLVGNSIEANVGAGLVVMNASAVNLNDGNRIAQLTNNTHDGRAYGIGIWRNSVVSVTGENTLMTSTHSPRLDAINAYYSSQLRSFYGQFTVSGDSSVGDHSEFNFRDVDYRGEIFLGHHGIVRLQNRPGQTFSGVRMTGNIIMSTFSTFAQHQNTRFNGDVLCNSNGLSAVYTSAGFTGTVSPSCGPNYLANQIDNQPQ